MMLDPTKVVEFVQLFTRSGKQMAAMIASPFASQSLKHLIVMLNSFPNLRKTKVHLRHLLLQHIDIVEVAMTTHGSSFLQFLVLDSYHFDDVDHEVKPPQGVDTETWTIQQSNDWSTHGGSTEFLLLDNAVSIEESKFGTLARNQAASHLIEVLLQVAPESTLQRLLETRFKSKLLEFVRHPVANFVVQKLIKCSRSLAQFEAIYNEIKPNMAEFYSGRSGVIVSLTQACLRFPSAQPSTLEDIIASVASFSGSTPEELKKAGFCKTILGLSNAPKHVFKKKKAIERNNQRKHKKDEGEEGEAQAAQDYEPIEFSPIGCQLLATLFKFDPKVVDFVLNDFVAMDTRHLLDMALNRNASRTFEAFLLSPAVSYSTKQTFSQNFAKEESFVTRLALDKSGSHVLDQLFFSSTVDTKVLFAEAVLSVEKALSAIHHGKFVLNNLRISEFRRNKDAWMKVESSKLTKKKAFDEILNFSSDASRKPSNNAPSNQNNQDAKKNKKKDHPSNTSTGRKADSAASPKPSSQSPHSKKHDNKGKDKGYGTKDGRKDDFKKGKHASDNFKQAQHAKASSSSSKMDVSTNNGDTASTSTKKRKRENNSDDIDDIFAAFEGKELATKKSKKVESEKKKSAPVASASKPAPAEAAPLSKLKQKKLAKAEKAAQRAAATN